MQSLLVALIVLACGGYAAWVLMPGAARRGLARTLLRWSWPEAMQRWLTRTAAVPTGCGCDGCDRGTPAATAGRAPVQLQAQPIKIHRPVKR